jgi:inward rectifier potassium channel
VTSPQVEDPKDLGFGTVVGGANERRLLNRDGTFNPRRHGLSFLRSLSAYHYFLTIGWVRFFAIVVVAYLVANTLFAFAYLACGPDGLSGVPPQVIGGDFARAFFFSVETLSTIGYGNISPTTLAANLVMTVEAFVGLLGFALGTGILFARFSRPTAAVLFSRIEGLSRKYDQLTLERTRVVFFPLSWTIVHPIDERSPLHGLSHADLVAKEAEVLILLTGTDETFSQTVHARSSYKPQEIAVGERFVNIYDPIDHHGVVSIDVRKLSETEPALVDDQWAHTTNWHTTGHFAGYAPPRNETKR